MDFTFSVEQDALRASVRRYLDVLVDAGTLRAMWDDEAERDRVWREMVELGWPAVLVPTDHGGLGLGLVDLVVVLEELGRRCVAAPFVSSAGLATLAAIRLGADELLGGLTSGSERGTIAVEEQGHGDPVDRIRARARRSGARWTVTGHHPLVFDGVDADWVIVAARTEEGMGSFLVRAPQCDPVPTIDVARQVGRLVLDECPAVPIGPAGDHTMLWRRIVDDAAVMLSAELVGVCDAALAMAVAYSQARVQFDVPLSSHQAIQHKLVDMLHATELGRVGVHYAAWCSDVDHPDRAQAAAIAKSAMGEGAVMVTSENIQVHGAVGFTWDSDAQVLYKRAKQNDVLFGSQAWHRRRISDGFLATG